MYWDRIDPITATVLRGFRKSPLMQSFYLSGGTALSLQIGHRISVDLDFFTQKLSAKVDAEKIINRLRTLFPRSKLSITYRAIDQLWLDLDDVKITFLAFPFARKHPLIDADGILLADVKDIALQKAFSIGRRAKARDYIDLAWLLHEERTTLEEISRDAREVFVEDGEPLFSLRLFLQQLGYTEVAIIYTISIKCGIM